jgi:hypothetical protein
VQTTKTESSKVQRSELQNPLVSRVTVHCEPSDAA